MKQPSSIRLYNMLFPIFYLYLFPGAWIIVLPLNFIIDSIVLILASRKQHIQNAYKQNILQVWLFGFLSDFVGALLLFMIALYTKDETTAEYIYTSPCKSLPSFLLVTLAILVSGIAIYLFNKKFVFKHLPKHQQHNLSLALAIFTAPYTFYLPLNWFL